MFIKRKLHAIGLLTLAALVFPGQVDADVIDVSIQSFQFDPQTVDIKVGDTVKWTNFDNVIGGHTSTSDTGVWDSGTLLLDDTFEFTFTQAGSFSYHCTPHPFMTGTVNVAELPLTVDSDTISESGGSVNFMLDAGAAKANRQYILLGGVSGTSPGTPLPGGLETLPLNLDFFTDIVFLLINSPVFNNFLGTLDGNGTSTATLTTGPVPGAAGLVMYYAFAIGFPYDFVSNPVEVTFVM
ncbi:MAG: plastocyanin/azurin family copper-binding protein [Planctomycetota bacterium]|jgi:plastocyanin